MNTGGWPTDLAIFFGVERFYAFGVAHRYWCV